MSDRPGGHQVCDEEDGQDEKWHDDDQDEEKDDKDVEDLEDGL